MNEKKEIRRLLILNFIIMYTLMVILIWISLNIKFQWKLIPYDYFYILINPLIITGVMNVALNYRVKYRKRQIDKSSLEYENFRKFMMHKKVKVVSSTNNSDICFVKNKHSFLPLKFIVNKSKFDINIYAPKVVLKEIKRL